MIIKLLAVFFQIYEILKLSFPAKESELRNNTVEMNNLVRVRVDGKTVPDKNKTPLWYVYNTINIVYGVYFILLLLSFNVTYMFAGVALFLISGKATKEQSTSKTVVIDALISLIILSIVFIA